MLPIAKSQALFPFPNEHLVLDLFSDQIEQMLGHDASH